MGTKLTKRLLLKVRKRLAVKVNSLAGLDSAGFLCIPQELRCCLVEGQYRLAITLRRQLDVSELGLVSLERVAVFARGV